MCIDSYADISIHTPTRGTTAGTGTATNLAEFQSTLPREERPFPTDFVTAFMPYFNPRSHERSDVSSDRRNYMYSHFNPRSHERSDGISVAPEAISEGFQSTLPREERRFFCEVAYMINNISIHAPTRGATLSASLSLMIKYYFNPRSHERSDITCKLPKGTKDHFNPRSHERSDNKTALCFL